jgi:hypothetical protein
MDLDPDNLFREPREQRDVQSSRIRKKKYASFETCLLVECMLAPLIREAERRGGWSTPRGLTVLCADPSIVQNHVE